LEYNQLLRILALNVEFRESEKGRLQPPKYVVCFGLPYSINKNKLDCKLCIFYKDKSIKLPQEAIIIQTDNIPPKISNITRRYYCPFCMCDVDKMDEGVYYKKYLNIILKLYEHLQSPPEKTQWNTPNYIRL
jgi:hypothetical protein